MFTHSVNPQCELKSECNETNKSPLSQVPNEIFLYILSFLDIKELCLMARISKQVNFYANNSRLWFQKFQIATYCQNNSPFLFNENINYKIKCKEANTLISIIKSLLNKLRAFNTFDQEIAGFASILSTLIQPKNLLLTPHVAMTLQGAILFPIRAIENKWQRAYRHNPEAFACDEGPCYTQDPIYIALQEAKEKIIQYCNNQSVNSANEFYKLIELIDEKELCNEGQKFYPTKETILSAIEQQMPMNKKRKFEFL